MGSEAGKADRSAMCPNPRDQGPHPPTQAEALVYSSVEQAETREKPCSSPRAAGATGCRAVWQACS